jgi:phosphoketolase
LSYESFVINGMPIIQTVCQAMAELRRKTPSIVNMYTAGALEQGRNGWTHQRPEIENYMAAMMRTGNFYSLFPCDANMIQAAYEWGTNTFNKGIAIVASKSALPIYTTMEQAKQAIEDGAITLYESQQGNKGTVVFAVTGDMVLLPVFEAKAELEQQGYKVRIVSVANPRRLYRPIDVAWDTVSLPDDRFMNDAVFNAMFDADIMIGITGGATGSLEPVMLRSRAAKRDVMGWKRGETTASPKEIMAFNGLSSDEIIERINQLAGA